MARKLTQLGRSVALPRSPAAAVLEAIVNPHPGTDYLVRFTAPEFTCLCPVTGQPDFAHLVIDFAPSVSIIESKSLKLYLASFRRRSLAGAAGPGDREHARGVPAHLVRDAGIEGP